MQDLRHPPALLTKSPSFDHGSGSRIKICLIPYYTR